MATITITVDADKFNQLIHDMPVGFTNELLKACNLKRDVETKGLFTLRPGETGGFSGAGSTAFKPSETYWRYPTIEGH